MSRGTDPRGTDSPQEESSPRSEHRPGSRPLPAHFRRASDSAGQPWEGRHFGETHAFAQDDGRTPQSLAKAIADFRAASAGPDAVVEQVREARLLIPLVAELGEEGVDDAGRRIDKTQELAIVTVAGPDGRAVLPAFSSVEAMKSWDAAARPVPAAGARVALAAAEEHTDLIVLDPGSSTEFAVRRPAVWALAQGLPWLPPTRDPAVHASFRAAARHDPRVLGVELADGDPDARLAGPEVIVRVSIVAGLDRPELEAVLSALSQRWASDDTIAERVDSLGVTPVAVAA